MIGAGAMEKVAGEVAVPMAAAIFARADFNFKQPRSRLVITRESG
jgi:hypothetical protein